MASSYLPPRVPRYMTTDSSVSEKEKAPDFFLWTIQIPQWRRLKTAGLKLIDITVKSGDHAFAPHGFDLKQYKAGQMTDAEYTERYMDKMLDSMQDLKHHWDHLSAYKYAVYGCYCPKDAFCHRHLFKELAKAHLEGMGWTPKLMGEFEGDLGGLEISDAFKAACPA